MSQQLSPRDAITQLIDLMSLVAEEAEVIAKGKKALFNAYLAQGFTRGEALQLIKPQAGNLF